MVNGKKEENTTAKVTEALAVVSQYCQKGDYASIQNLCHTLGYSPGTKDVATICAAVAKSISA